MQNKGLNNKFYMDYILAYLKTFKYATRKDINNLIYPKLLDILDNEGKNRRVKYLLARLRERGYIINTGSDRYPKWKLKNNL